jgi:hypothetical protein
MKKPKQNDNQKLYEHIKKRISLLQESAGVLYLGCPDHRNTIHGISTGIRDLKDIFFDLLFDETPARKILENRE